ncbi:unnamed protein product [Meganyctiphanes norvegica]|uniref:C2H2-type domain-containing protein n=1 Tax=Meganyctiphanes norvegica TaxID=48144 RepID=A0AAV2STX8_MEGNR
MDPNIYIKQELPQDSSLSFETYDSESYKIEDVENKEFDVVSDIKLEGAGHGDVTLKDKNNIPCATRSVHMVNENEISTMPRKRKYTNTSSLIHVTKKEKSLSCIACKIDFVSISTFIGHLNAVHREDGINPIRSCPICDYDFTTLSEGVKVLHMWDHSVEVSQSGSHMKVAEIQTKKQNVKIEYRNEKQIENTNKRLKNVGEHSCSLCSMSFRNLADLISHMDMHKKVKQYFCDVCDLQFKTDNELAIHIPIHEKEKVDPVKGKELMISTVLGKRNCTHRCPICNGGLMDMSTFIIHWKGKHPNVQICPLCKKDYSNKAAFLVFLTEHMQEHSSEEFETYLHIKVPEIQFLGLDRKKNKSANKATASNTKKSMKVGEYLCPLCKKSFTALTDMISHIDDHKQVKNFYCSVCKLQFKTDDELKRHMQTHEIEKFNLVQGKEFKSNEAIEKYDSVIHNSACARRECVTETNSESINCPICYMSFIGKTAAVSHFQRLHICPICEIFMPTKNDMDDHIKSHACQTCRIAKSVHQIKSKANNVIQKNNCCIFCNSQLNDNSFVCICNICNKRLPISQYLKLHVSGHAEHFKYRVFNKEIVRKPVPAPYGCLLCHINYANNELFMEHMNIIHTYDKETNLYMCSICNIGFNEVIELTIHNEEHFNKINL